LQALGLAVTPSVGNFVLVKFGTGAKNAAAANAFLNARAIIPRTVDNYGLPEHLRITIGTESEVKAVQESLGRFVAANK